MRQADSVPQGWAINDVVVRAGMRMVDIEIYIDGHYVNTYPGDGMIVSTPHGSTAYCMAAGGPILTAGVRGFAIVPISCHRPIRTPLGRPGRGRDRDGRSQRSRRVADSRRPRETRAGAARTSSRCPRGRTRSGWSRSGRPTSTRRSAPSSIFASVRTPYRAGVGMKNIRSELSAILAACQALLLRHSQQPQTPCAGRARRDAAPARRGCADRAQSAAAPAGRVHRPGAGQGDAADLHRGGQAARRVARPRPASTVRRDSARRRWRRSSPPRWASACASPPARRSSGRAISFRS